LAGTGDVVLVVLARAGQTNSATTLDLFLPTSGDRQTDRQAILLGHGGATRRPELATRWSWRRRFFSWSLPKLSRGSIDLQVCRCCALGPWCRLRFGCLLAGI